MSEAPLGSDHHHAHNNGRSNGHSAPANPIVGLETLTKPRRGVKGTPWRVAAVVPGFGKHKDVELLLKDFSRLDLRGIEFWVVLVDNATPNRPLSDIPTPPNVRLEHLRLTDNTGGAGGFNAGMARVLAGEGLTGEFDPPDFLWLVDSDARVSRRSLRELIKALAKHQKLCAVGSALVDIATGVCYEIGGNMDKRNGFFVPAARGDVDRRKIIPCDYLAACSALVRREAIEQTGLMPNIFIHGDDVEWFLQMTRKTGKKVAGVVASRAGHPLWNRKFQTWVRYYTTRNAYAPIDVMGFGPTTRFRRALVDVLRATGQSIMGMDELAELHLRGLDDAGDLKTVGHAIPGGMMPIIQSTKMRPFSQFAQAMREELAKLPAGSKPYVHPLMALRASDLPGFRQALAELNLLPPSDWKTHPDWKYWHHRSLGSHVRSDMSRAIWRAVVGAPNEVAIVPTGQPSGWFRGRTLFLLTADGFQVRTVNPRERVGAAITTFRRGIKAALKLRSRPRTFHTLPQAPVRKAVAATGRQIAPSAVAVPAFTP